MKRCPCCGATIEGDNIADVAEFELGFARFMCQYNAMLDDERTALSIEKPRGNQEK